MRLHHGVPMLAAVATVAGADAHSSRTARSGRRREPRGHAPGRSIGSSLLRVSVMAWRNLDIDRLLLTALLSEQRAELRPGGIPEDQAAGLKPPPAALPGGRSPRPESRATATPRSDRAGR